MLSDYLRHVVNASSGSFLELNWATKKTSYFPLYWFFNRDPYSGLLSSPQHKWVVQSPTYPEQPGVFFIAQLVNNFSISINCIDCALFLLPSDSILDLFEPKLQHVATYIQHFQVIAHRVTLQGTNISFTKARLKMIFLFTEEPGYVSFVEGKIAISWVAVAFFASHSNNDRMRTRREPTL